MAAINKAYDPKQVEARRYQQWLDAGCFKGRAGAGEAYCVMIPPPNVTGILTMGHVLNNTIQDILVRRARLEGKNALWMPGTDHASIATQNKVEQALKKEGKHKRDLGREAFVQRTWEWSHEYGGIILKQLRRLGASCDWERTAFTMDPAYVRAVLHSFVELYKRGYIYRGKRMVNWCPGTQTALSDEEVIMKPQRGFFYRVRYEIVERPGEFVEVSTTRPETIPGDTAVAFHPDDERYQHLKGCHVWRPLSRAAIPLICDAAVDKEFGSGMLKVTPAHDRVDYDIGLRHKLPIIDVLNPDGTLNALAGELAGMERFKGRKEAAKLLKDSGALLEEKPYENNVGFSERADVPIEPRLTEQWWMRYPKVEEAKAAVRDGLIKFWPDRWEKVYLHWLDNIQDWCISRQLWWGQRIPVWYRKGADRNDPANWHVSIDGPSDAENWEQDEDVLDTWASSWLWPFATFGWPDMSEEQKKELAYFYPTSDLVTGPDIIFFWVARMIMAGLEFMGPEKKSLTADEIRARIPFKNVYFTGIIRDGQGRKMSKSLGNSPDPLDLIDFYGADGLRFGIMSVAPKGQDIRFAYQPPKLGKDGAVEKAMECPAAELGRNFCNKLWNASRFRQMNGGDALVDNTSVQAIAARMASAELDGYDHWILSRTLSTLEKVEALFRDYEFNPIIQELYDLFWADFCDWYVEASKAKLQNEATKAGCLAVQDFVLREILLMLAPFCPHITEELWQLLGYCLEGGATVSVAQNPFWKVLRDSVSLRLDEPIEISERRLPHWQQDGVSYFVTFRLADSLPAEKLNELNRLRGEWIANRSQPLSDSEQDEYFQSFHDPIENWLDDLGGNCLLKDKKAAKIVSDALMHFNGDRYSLGAWVVMPNHVHAVVTPKNGHNLSDILHSWKSFSAHEINKTLGREGAVWQKESYDHIIRSEDQHWAIHSYILNNPTKANLGDNYEFSSANYSKSDFVLGNRDGRPTLKAGPFLQDHRIESAADLRKTLSAAGLTLNGDAVAQVESLKEVVQKGRALKIAYNLASKRDVTFFFTAEPASRAFLEAQADTLKRLMGAQSLSWQASAPDAAPAAISSLGTLYLDLASAVDVESEKKRLAKELEQLAKAISGAEAKLGNENFTAKAPADVVEGIRQTLSANLEKRAELERLLSAFGG